MYASTATLLLPSSAHPQRLPSQRRLSARLAAAQPGDTGALHRVTESRKGKARRCPPAHHRLALLPLGRAALDAAMSTPAALGAAVLVHDPRIVGLVLEALRRSSVAAQARVLSACARGPGHRRRGKPSGRHRTRHALRCLLRCFFRWRVPTCCRRRCPATSRRCRFAGECHELLCRPWCCRGSRRRLSRHWRRLRGGHGRHRYDPVLLRTSGGCDLQSISCSSRHFGMIVLEARGRTRAPTRACWHGHTASAP